MAKILHTLAWHEILEADFTAPARCAVTFPSHKEEVHDSITGTANRFDDLCEAIRSLLDQKVELELVHKIQPETLALLPDLIRFIDDRFREVQQIRFEVDREIEGARPFFLSALTTCLSRELPFEAPESAPWSAWAENLSYQREKSLPSEVVAERVALADAPQSSDDLRETLEKMLHYLGGVERFLGDEVGHVLGRDFGERLKNDALNLTEEEASDLQDRDPRSALRYPKSMAAHQAIGSFFAPAQGERPRVLIHLAAPCSDTLSMLSALLSFSERSIALPEVLVSQCAESKLKDEITALCSQNNVPLHFTKAIEASSRGGTCYDFQINLCGSECGALDGSFAIHPQNEVAGRRDEALAQWTQGKQWYEIRPWTMSASSSSSTVVTEAGANLEYNAPSAADLWLLSLPAERLWMAGLDPIPMDRLAFDAQKKSPDWLCKLIEARNPYARPEGVQTYGEVTLDRVSNPKGVPAIIKEQNRRLVVLGLASTTLQNHGATLLIDGQIVGAVQEERFRRRKQLGWHPPGKPYDTVVSNPRIPLERSWPKRSIQAVLEMGGITMDDVDCVAYNGIPQQYLHTYDLYDPARPPQTIADGKNMFVPHHLTHAASAYRVSGLKDSVIFTVDGRGERETAAFFEVEDGRIHRLFDILCNKDSLIGGVYEYFTTILGFGHHGAGSTMGLACMGPPKFDVSNFLSAQNRNSYEIHDRGIGEAWGHLSRSWGDPMSEDHIALASSVQFALEATVLSLITDGLGPRRKPNLCMAGGVALNCRMNQVVRDYFDTPNIYVQPAAHDSGTSLGAALEAHFEITGEAQPMVMEHALLGPSYSNEKIAQTLQRFGLPVDKRADIATEVGDLIADGKIVCWFQDGLEFGPRALGARSILSDPRFQSTKDRMNVMKGRQWWRPLGPSILAGHEADWFDRPMHSPFMLFTLPVRQDKLDKIPAVLHTDGTSRPQSVLKSTHPKYHAAISQFYKNTGVPMVVNTSFNTAFEPIVNTPEDAISTFLQLGADYLAIGDYLVPKQ